MVESSLSDSRTTVCFASPSRGERRDSSRVPRPREAFSFAASDETSTVARATNARGARDGARARHARRPLAVRRTVHLRQALGASQRAPAPGPRAGPRPRRVGSPGRVGADGGSRAREEAARRGYGVTPPDPSYDSNAMRPARRKPPPRGSAPGVAEVFAGAFPTRSDGAVETYLGADGFAGRSAPRGSPGRRPFEPRPVAARVRARDPRGARSPRGATSDARANAPNPAPAPRPRVPDGGGVCRARRRRHHRGRRRRLAETRRTRRGRAEGRLRRPTPADAEPETDGSPRRRVLGPASTPDPRSPRSRDETRRRNPRTRRDASRVLQGTPAGAVGGSRVQLRGSRVVLLGRRVFALRRPREGQPRPRGVLRPVPRERVGRDPRPRPGDRLRQTARETRGGAAKAEAARTCGGPARSRRRTRRRPARGTTTRTSRSRRTSSPAPRSRSGSESTRRTTERRPGRPRGPGDARRSSEFSVPGPGTYDVDGARDASREKVHVRGADGAGLVRGRARARRPRAGAVLRRRVLPRRRRRGGRVQTRGGYAWSRGAGFSFGAAPKFPKETADPVPGRGGITSTGRTKRKAATPRRTVRRPPAAFAARRASKPEARVHVRGPAGGPPRGLLPERRARPGGVPPRPRGGRTPSTSARPAFSLAGRLRSARRDGPRGRRGVLPGGAYQSASARNPHRRRDPRSRARRASDPRVGRGVGRAGPRAGREPRARTPLLRGPSFTMAMRVDFITGSVFLVVRGCPRPRHCKRERPGVSTRQRRFATSCNVVNKRSRTLREKHSRSRLPGPTLKSRDAWRTGWVPAGAVFPPPGRTATSRTRRRARARRRRHSRWRRGRARRARRAAPRRGTSGPARPRGRPRGGVRVRGASVSFTFGPRFRQTRREKASALVPGPGSYQAARSLEHTSRGRCAPAFTMGERLRDPASEELSSVGPAGFSERRVPGSTTTTAAYVIGDLVDVRSRVHDVRAARGRGGSAEGSRRARAGASTVGPFDPASAGEATRASPGARAPSFAPNVMSGRDAPAGPGTRSRTPWGSRGRGAPPRCFSSREGPRGRRGGGRFRRRELWGRVFVGAQGVHVRVEGRVRRPPPARDGPDARAGEYQSGGPLTRSLGDSSEWRPRGITIGARLGREAERARGGARRRARAPGRTAPRTVLLARARADPRAARSSSRSAWERARRRERRGRGAGPRGVRRREPQGEEARGEESAEIYHRDEARRAFRTRTRGDAPPSPPRASTNPRPRSPTVRRLSAGPTIVGERRPSPGAESGRLVPAPGEYEPDAATAEARRRRDARSAVGGRRRATRRGARSTRRCAGRRAHAPGPGRSNRRGEVQVVWGATVGRRCASGRARRGRAGRLRRAARRRDPGTGRIRTGRSGPHAKTKRLPGFTIPSATRDRGSRRRTRPPAPGRTGPTTPPGGFVGERLFGEY